jgi:hypothetical protein
MNEYQSPKLLFVSTFFMEHEISSTRLFYTAMDQNLPILVIALAAAEFVLNQVHSTWVQAKQPEHLHNTPTKTTTKHMQMVVAAAVASSLPSV